MLLGSIAYSPVDAKEPLKLDQETWEQKAGGLDYSENIKPKEPEEQEPDKPAEAQSSPPDSPPLFDAEVLKVILISLLIALLIVVIVMVVIKAKAPATVAKERVAARTLEEAEENLPDVELDQIYEQSLNDGSLRIALRIKFLMVLQTLIDRGLIEWKKRKTNHEYEREIDDTAVRWQFSDIMHTFESVWYGTYELERSEFDRVAGIMQTLKTRLSGE